MERVNCYKLHNLLAIIAYFNFVEYMKDAKLSNQVKELKRNGRYFI